MSEFGLEVKMRKFAFVICCISVISLSIGWYPEDINKGINVVTGQAGSYSAMLCMVEENQGLFTQGVRETSEEERREREQMDEKNRRKAKIDEKKWRSEMEKRRILERIVEAEAGDQDLKGRVLVANVILNRVKSKKFPNTVKGVVFARRQFSPVSNGSYYRVKVSPLTKKAVKKALKGKNYSKGALYFMCRSASDPSNVTWFDRDLTRLFSYGCHEFFK